LKIKQDFAIISLQKRQLTTLSGSELPIFILIVFMLCFRLFFIRLGEL